MPLLDNHTNLTQIAEIIREARESPLSKLETDDHYRAGFIAATSIISFKILNLLPEDLKKDFLKTAGF